MADLFRRWRIVEVDDAWELDLDIEQPARLEIGRDGLGEMVFFLLAAAEVLPSSVTMGIFGSTCGSTSATSFGSTARPPEHEPDAS